jgi:hypothetical protein
MRKLLSAVAMGAALISLPALPQKTAEQGWISMFDG